MNETSANEIIYRLIEENCFAPDGRLGIYPEWLDYKAMQSLVSIGVFREQHGNGDTYGHTDYYLNPCCEKQALSSNCTWPNCLLFHIQRAVEHVNAPDGLQAPDHEHFYFPVRAGGPMRCVVCNARR